MCGDGRLVDMKAYVNGRLGGIEAGACGAGLRRRPAAPAGACRRLRRLRRLCGPPCPMRSSVPAIISPSRDKVTKNPAIRGTALCVETVGSST